MPDQEYDLFLSHASEDLEKSRKLVAVALTLEHLRAVERYGATSEKQEQYTGWLRLPAAGANDEATECAKILI